MTAPVRKKTAGKIWSRPAFAISIAATALILGYADLVRGGLTVSAALLTIGYLILVPAAIVAVPAAVRQSYHDRKRVR